MSDVEILEDKKEMFIDTLYACYRQSEVKPFEKAIENLIQENKELKEKNTIFALNGSNIRLELYIEENYIPKSKVKEKIEEFKDDVKRNLENYKK